MSANLDMGAVTPSSQTAAVIQTSAANATTAGAVASANLNVNSTGTVATVGSMEALKLQSPETYKKILQGMGQTICSQMRKQQEALKKLQREYNQ
jgi:hypothetical protein